MEMKEAWPDTFDEGYYVYQHKIIIPTHKIHKLQLTHKTHKPEPTPKIEKLQQKYSYTQYPPKDCLWHDGKKELDTR